MNYGRLQPSDPGGSDRHDNPDTSHRRRSTIRLVLLAILSLALLLASAASATLLLLKLRPGGPSAPKLDPTSAISRTCGLTRFPNLCLDALASFPGAEGASEGDLVHISFNVTLQRFSKALYVSSTIGNLQMEPRVRSAFDDCLELLYDSVDALRRSLSYVAPGGAKYSSGSAQDVVTWLSAAMTNQDTCTEGFDDVSGGVKGLMAERLRDLSELVSNCLAIFTAASGQDFDGVPIQNRRRRLMGSSDGDASGNEMPSWLGRKERRLLQMPATTIQADVTVSKDGNGTCKTISEAIKRAPDYGTRRFIIYVRAGR